MKLSSLLVVVVLVSGCATGPYTPIGRSSLEGEKVIYFEQVDRVPKEVLLVVCDRKAGETNTEMTARVIPWMEMIPMIEKMSEVAPEIIKSYSDERMANALITRRMLFKGYETNDLVEIEKIVQAMGMSIENWSPQNVLRKK